MAKELTWAGFDIVSFANNHATDWGVDGMRMTRQHAGNAGLIVAGVGESLAEARAAQFVETGKGRVALVATASTFTSNARAGASLGDIPSRPGLSPLRTTTTNVLSSAGVVSLRALATDLGLPVPQGDRFNFLGQSYTLGQPTGRRTEPNQADLAQIAAAVRAGRDQSDLAIVSIHAHEGGANQFVPAEFLVTFARTMVEAGADIVVGHGPHVLRGIEIYQGKPIFYSLGDFIFENETLDRLPLDDYETFGSDPANGVSGLNDVRYANDTRGFPAQQEIWESVIAVPRFLEGALQSIDLHPVTLGFGGARTQRGRPMLAEGASAEKIIADLQRLSEPMGTVISYRNGMGTVVLD